MPLYFTNMLDRPRSRRFDETPSIVHQTPWPCGIFNFGRASAPGTDYFNCGLVPRPDGLWLIPRRSRWRKDLMFGMNDLMAFHLDPELQPTHGHEIRMDRRFEGEHFEDPRAVLHGSQLFVSCCTFIVVNKSWTGAHQIIAQVDGDWKNVRRYDPLYGHNGGNTGLNSGSEKNWVWFWHENQPHLRYSARPSIVVRFSEDFKPVGEHITQPDLSGWVWGEVRGGTPPIRVGDEYWTFFHSSTPWTTKFRQYHMGAYAFEARPPFRLTRISTRPIISGSPNDRWAQGKPIVVFPCGAFLENNRWLVTLGLNDLDCAWINIPHDELLPLTTAV